MHFCFIILHYKAIDVTKKCIDLLLRNFGTEDISIVAVDNASPDGSGRELELTYSEEKRVHTLLLGCNEGFARGNNAGYSFAIRELSPDFIIVMNNDVFIHDSGFLDKVADEYKSRAYAVLGPDILSEASGLHQNPLRLTPMTEKEAVKLKKTIDCNLRCFPFHYIYWGIKKRFKASAKHDAFEAEAEGCVLHGACMVFSKDFIQAREHAFNPSTFLYVEEDILQYECSRAGLAMRYSPHLSVSHMEDASSKAMFRLNYNRTRFQYRHISDSLEVLINLMEENKK